ncbi:RDD family protein [Pseudalkalibacillus sp. A8]|uniref:RDD family protein n=1 Tax=Pseudalkalibacillus sp. A8 TaxID=3382641 RepID=UPI0038B5E485
MRNNLQIASRKSRIYAFLIDHVLLTFIITFPFIIILMTHQESMETGIMFTFFYIAMIIALIIYTFKDVFKGVSPGKWLFGIGVRDEDDLTSSVHIEVIFEKLTDCYMDGRIFRIACNKKKQRLGDKLAKTVVVKTREMSVGKRIVVILSAIIIIFSLMFVSIIFIFKGSEAYKTSENYIKHNPEIIENTGGIEGFGFFPSGSIQTRSGHGEAFFTVKVMGEEKDIYVDIYLTKIPRTDWNVKKVNYHK